MIYYNVYLIDPMNNIHFRAMYTFIKRYKKVDRYKKNIQKYLYRYLYKPVIKQYKIELIPDKRLNLIYYLDIQTRISLNRFKILLSIGNKILDSESYTIKDVVNRREFRKYRVKDSSLYKASTGRYMPVLRRVRPNQAIFAKLHREIRNSFSQYIFIQKCLSINLEI